MTRAGWRHAVLEAVKRHEAGDSVLLDLMADLLREQDQAKHQLREIGFGVTGTPWLDMVDEVRDRCAS